MAAVVKYRRLGDLKQQTLYLFILYGSGSQKSSSRCQQGCAPSEGSCRGWRVGGVLPGLFQLLVMVGNHCSWLVAASLQLPPVSSPGLLPCVSLCPDFSLLRTPVTGVEHAPIQRAVIAPEFHPQTSRFQVTIRNSKMTLQVLGIRAGTHLFVGRSSTHKRK